jgi:hypothetical protein
MGDLFTLVEKYGTDKSLSGYTFTYSDLFTPIKDQITSVLEIGIGTLNPKIPSSFFGNTQHFDYYEPGGSLKVWRDFFSNATVYGVDIAKDCMFEEERIKTFLFDSSESEYTDYYLNDLTFDIIIDDGNHDPKYQVKTLKNLFPKLNKNGYYIIEDIGGYPGTEELLIEYLDEFNLVTKGYQVTNKGNHIVIQKTKLQDTIPTSNESITLVTGLWNINRPGRDFDHYIENFKKFLDIPLNMFIYIPAKYEYLVWEKRSKENTFVKVYELDDIKTLYSPFWDKTQQIRTNPEWYNQTGENGWLVGSPQAHLEWYNPIVQSKMFMLNDATIWNPFNNEYFVWLDAGITNTVYEKYFTDDKALDKIIPHLDTFLFLSYPYEASSEIHGFNFKAINRFAGKKVKYVCRGGLFGGRKEIINQANGLYYSLLENTLGEGYMGTEESIFTIMSYNEPEKYRRYALDGNGLVVKFIQALLEDKVELEPIPKNRVFLKPKNLNTSKLKTSLYMLTFNFPEQVEHTIKTWNDSSSDWLLKPHKKILIDNSNKPEAIEGNKLICEKYGFEHIITGENLGINRGRQYAAEHFDKSDSDFYFFFEDDMGLYSSVEDGVCRNGFKKHMPNLYDTVHKIMLKEDFDFLKLSFTEVYMDNNIQVSWYNVPQNIRTEMWPKYDKLPIQGIDPNAPRTKFKHIDVLNELSYISGDIYYANWPMIVSREGNRKMFLDTTWAYPYEQTWMSHMFQETVQENIKPAVLLASPIFHNRISHYKAEERREN